MTKSLHLNLVWTLLLVSFGLEAQSNFFKFFPETDHFVHSSVSATPDGALLNYFSQDTEEGNRNAFVRIDIEGNPIWRISTGDSAYSYFSAYTLSDNSMVLGGGISIPGQFGSTGWGLVTYVNAQGEVQWSKRVTASTGMGVSNVISDGEKIFVTMASYSWISSTQYWKSTLLAYDMQGNLLWTRGYAGAGLFTNYHFRYLTLTAGGDLLGAIDVGGSQNNQTRGVILTKVSPSGDLIFSKYVEIPIDGSSVSVNGLVESLDGDYFLALRLIPQSQSAYQTTAWIAKFNDEGTLLSQKTLSAGVDVGEEVAGLSVDNSGLVLHVRRYSPFETITRSVDLLSISEEDLSIQDAQSIEFGFTRESVYGDDLPSIIRNSEGSFFTSTGFFCEATSTSYPGFIKWNVDYETACSTAEVTSIYTDSVTTFTTVDLGEQTGPTLSHGSSSIVLTNEAMPITANFCDGCDNPTGIKEQIESKGFSVFPNPNAGSFVVQMPCSEKQQYQIFDLQGRMIQSGQVGNAESINIQHLERGIYLLKVAEQSTKIILTN
jgi:hypothetical protein